MKKLLALVTLAIAALHGFAKSVADLKEALSDRDELIADLKKQLDDENATHAELLERIDTAEAHSEELSKANAEAEAKAAELAAALNDEPAVPSVDPGTFAVTAPATGTVNDLNFRDQQAEAAPTPDAAPAPAAAPEAPAATQDEGQGQQAPQ